MVSRERSSTGSSWFGQVAAQRFANPWQLQQEHDAQKKKKAPQNAKSAVFLSEETEKQGSEIHWERFPLNINYQAFIYNL